MGRLKGLLTMGRPTPTVGTSATGEELTFLEWQLRRFAAAGGTRAVVVLGWRSDEYVERLPALAALGAPEGGAWAGIAHVVVARNDAPERGSFSSLVTGIEAAVGLVDDSGSAAPVFVLPIDVPAPAAPVWSALAGAGCPRDGAVTPRAPLEYGGHGGHPVLLGDRFARSLLAVPPADPEARLDRQLGRLAESERRLVTLSGDQLLSMAIGLNLNTPDDWAAWTAELARSDVLAR